MQPTQPFSAATASYLHPLDSQMRRSVEGVRPQFQLPGAYFGPDKFFSMHNRITMGVLRPAINHGYEIPIEIHGNGVIMQRGIDGYEAIGVLTPTGDYQLKNGNKGNLFRSDSALVINYQQHPHPFLRALQNAEQQRAIGSSEIPMIRQNLNAQGYTGRGISVADLEFLDLKENTDCPLGICQEEIIHPHVYSVSAVINDKTWGVAPEAMVFSYNMPHPEELDLEEDSLPQLIDGVLVKVLTDSNFGAASRQLEQIMRDRALNPSIRVISVPCGISRVDLYQQVEQAINTKTEEGDFEFPKTRSAVLGSSIFGNSDQQFQSIINFVDHVLDTHPAVLNAHQSYIETTRRAAEQGCIITVSVGNSHNDLPSCYSARADAEYNVLAESPYVIGVAAANTHGSPGQYNKYTVADFSSRGDGHRWNPTIAAPGDEIMFPTDYGPIAKNRVSSGTSYSEPFTAGVITLMLQKNPNLNFQEVKRILEQTATLGNFTAADAGAGMLNVMAAMNAVPLQNKTPLA